MIRMFQVAYSISDHRKTNLILESGTFPHTNINLLLLYMHEIEIASLHESSGWITAKPAGYRLISLHTESQLTR